MVCAGPARGSFECTNIIADGTGKAPSDDCRALSSGLRAAPLAPPRHRHLRRSPGSVQPGA